MRAVCQRVVEARVRVEERVVGEIGVGLCVLLGVAVGDSGEQAGALAGKIARLRIFPDDAGRFDRSLLDIDGDALVVSQFTLLADSKRQKGTRPDFSKAAPREEAEAEFRKVLELSPVDDYAHYALGRCLQKQGREREANAHYKLASSLSPDSKQYRARIKELD